MSFVHSWRVRGEEPPLLQWVDLNLAAVVLAMPFVMGGRHPFGYLLVTLFSVAAAVGWLLHQAQTSKAAWITSPLDIFFAAGVGIVVLQLIPWPNAQQSWLMPKLDKLLPMASGETGSIGFARWTQISFTPAATREGLALLLAYGLLFVTTVQRLQNVSAVERLLKWIAVAAVSMATVGLAQYLTTNGKFLWIYADPFRDTRDVVKGAFINQNHFAHFLALGIPPLLWWTASITSRSDPGKWDSANGTRNRAAQFPIWLWLAVGVVGLSGSLSLSRGGIAAMIVAAIVCVALLHRAGVLNKQLTWSIVALGGFLCVAMAVHGSQGLINRWSQVTSGSLNQLDRAAGRRQIWSADLQAVENFPLLGTGVGSHTAVYPMYFPGSSDQTEYTHAECGYLQVALECGLVGLALVVTTIGICFHWCWVAFRSAPSNRHRACAAAVSASLVISALHSLVDFVWFIPACMATTILLAACAYRLCLFSKSVQPVSEQSRTVLPTYWRLGAAFVGLLGCWMLVQSLGPALAAPAWDRYLRLATAMSKAERIAADTTLPRDDANEQASASKRSLEKMITELETVIKYDPSQAIAHARLSAARIQLFELLQQDAPNPMPLAAVRDAALQSHFSSRAELDKWLTRAIGPHYIQLEQARCDARGALALCPLLGEAYLYLSELCFLEGSDLTANSRYLAQALAVRPYDGEIQFEAGKQCFLDGQPQQAIEHWRQAYRSGEEFRLRLVDLFANELATQVPIGFFLEQFQPDLEGLRRLRLRYSTLQLPAQWRTLLEYSTTQIVKQAESTSGRQACGLWLEAEPLYRELGDAKQRMRCVDQALSADANNYSARYAAGMCFYEENQFDQAETQVKWCLSRAPNDANLKRVHDAVVKGRLEQGQPPKEAAIDRAVAR
jgi:O-antigen ligase